MHPRTVSPSTLLDSVKSSTNGFAVHRSQSAQRPFVIAMVLLEMQAKQNIEKITVWMHIYTWQIAGREGGREGDENEKWQLEKLALF